MDEENQGSDLDLSPICLVEAEEEQEDSNIRTYENAVTLYEDKQYYPDAEDVRVVFFSLRARCSRAQKSSSRRKIHKTSRSRW